MSKLVTLEGFEELQQVLRNLPSSIRSQDIIKAGRLAAKPLVKQARANLNAAQTKTSGNLDGFEHLRALSKNTKVVAYKGGVNVQVKGPDLPMKSNRGMWNIYGVARLFAFGRGKDKGTGTTKGVGDWITEAGNQLSSFITRIFRKSLTDITGAGIKKTIAKYGYNG